MKKGRLREGVIDRGIAMLYRRHLDQVLWRLPATPPPAGRPILYVGNHVSWFDGFLVRTLHRALAADRQLYTVMLESELRRYAILRQAGAVGIEPGSVASLRTFRRFMARAAEKPGEVAVSFFPQGAIWPSTRRPLGFQPGVKIIPRAMGPVWVQPVGLHLAPGNRPKPTAYVVPGEGWLWEEGEAHSRMEKKVERTLDEVLDHLHEWGERAPGAWIDSMVPYRSASAPRSNGRVGDQIVYGDLLDA